MRRLSIGLVAGMLLAAGAIGATGRAPDLGANTDLHGRQVLPADDLWNKDVSKEPVDPRSEALIVSIGRDRPLHPDFGIEWKGAPSGIPYVIVDGKQPKVPVTYTEYGDESDPGPFPIPADAPIEGGAKSDGDRHVLVIDRDHWVLYELWHAFPSGDGKGWKAGCGAVFDLKKGAGRPKGWTSADAAGLPIFPGLVRYDEVVGSGAVRHAVRFTVKKSRRAFVPPASHFASRSNDATLPPMGMRVRLKADVDVSKYPPAARVILEGLKTYGMILADNGGDWFISGAPDPRWNEEELGTLRRVRGKDLEVVRTGAAEGK